ncbi:zinc ribbon domain-containing protein [Endozoicomonas sp. GU-1]|uniref:zinc ribbon domain-containing protein n=1 Tax=Endozoicomonas sp. GU-1 TaxID=3009078 RepID=UPI0022B56119|nr:zinc ribbon domain-containing protein [Endozoicomonas sp. GU-1]WBA82118.1 zinc ribbon domain-containing protein [Endozoicomonas sp. GU-1]WBA85061.1 zinc ribbon domain-containing protein [Endozoicomonas sp. GU-1]
MGKSKKYGKHVVDCNEAYTSKTRSWNGSIDDRLGALKVIKGNGFTVDRDINGARNIFIKNLTRQLEPEVISSWPNGIVYFWLSGQLLCKAQRREHSRSYVTGVATPQSD